MPWTNPYVVNLARVQNHSIGNSLPNWENLISLILDQSFCWHYKVCFIQNRLSLRLSIGGMQLDVILFTEFWFSLQNYGVLKILLKLTQLSTLTQQCFSYYFILVKIIKLWLNELILNIN